MTNFPVRDEDIRALRLKVLRALASATYPKEAIGLIAANNGLTVPDAKSLVDSYGYPDKSEMARFVIELSGGEVARPPVIARSTTNPRPVPRATLDQVRVDPPEVAVPDYRAEALLNAGEKSKKARTRRLAVKIRQQLAELRGLINSESAEREAKVARTTQKRPESPIGGTVLVKLTIRVPKAAFLPLRPAAVVVIPEDMTETNPVEVVAENP